MPTKRRKKRKRRQKSKQVELDLASVNSEFVKLDEPLPLPKCLQKGDEENDSLLILNGNNIGLLYQTHCTI